MDPQGYYQTVCVPRQSRALQRHLNAQIHKGPPSKKAGGAGEDGAGTSMGAGKATGKGKEASDKAGGTGSGGKGSPKGGKGKKGGVEICLYRRQMRSIMGDPPFSGPCPD